MMRIERVRLPPGMQALARREHGTVVVYVAAGLSAAERLTAIRKAMTATPEAGWSSGSPRSPALLAALAGAAGLRRAPEGRWTYRVLVTAAAAAAVVMLVALTATLLGGGQARPGAAPPPAAAPSPAVPSASAGPGSAGAPGTSPGHAGRPGAPGSPASPGQPGSAPGKHGKRPAGAVPPSPEASGTPSPVPSATAVPPPGTLGPAALKSAAFGPAAQLGADPLTEPVRLVRLADDMPPRTRPQGLPAVGTKPPRTQRTRCAGRQCRRRLGYWSGAGDIGREAGRQAGRARPAAWPADRGGCGPACGRAGQRRRGRGQDPARH